MKAKQDTELRTAGRIGSGGWLGSLLLYPNVLIPIAVICLILGVIVGASLSRLSQ